MRSVAVAVEARRQLPIQCRSSSRGMTKLTHVQQYGGLCTLCPDMHMLCSTPEAVEAAQKLLAAIDHHGRLDFDSPIPDPRFSTDWLWTKGPGRMLGVLTAVDQQGQSRILKAFSGQITESWHIPGWVGPVAYLTNTSQQYKMTRSVIEQLSEKLQELQLLSSAHQQQPIDALPLAKCHRKVTSAPAAARRGKAAQQRQLPAVPTHQKHLTTISTAERFIAQQQQLLKSRRKSVSHHLLHCIQQSYQTLTVSGQRLSLLDIYLSYVEQHDPRLPLTRLTGALMGMPAGVGDCCAPKLLHAAAEAQLTPTGLVEVWCGSPPGTATPAKQGRMTSTAGSSGSSGSTRQHGTIYGMCDKCKAVLGTMLCGLPGEADVHGGSLSTSSD